MSRVSLAELRTFPRAVAQLERPAGQKHHYIPKFYLKQWTGSDGRLCEFSRPHTVVKARRVHPGGTGYMRSLYTFDALPPSIANFMENQFLMRADHLSYSALCELLDNNVHLDREKRCGWSRFLMTQIHRTPEGIERLLKRIATDYPQYLEDAIGELPADLRTPENEKIIHRLRVNVTDADMERLALQSLRLVMDSEHTGTVLNSMLIGVIHFDETHHPLLTSDRPLVMTNGLRFPHSHIVMPISPRRVFVATNNPEMMKKIIDLAEHGGFAMRLNNHMARQARKYVYAIDDKQLWFVEGRLGEQAVCSPFE